MDDVRDDVIIARPFKTNPCIFGVWHKYFEATFVIAACILMLTLLAIYVAHRYRRTRDRVGVRTIVPRFVQCSPYHGGMLYFYVQLRSWRSISESLTM